MAVRRSRRWYPGLEPPRRRRAIGRDRRREFRHGGCRRMRARASPSSVRQRGTRCRAALVPARAIDRWRRRLRRWLFCESDYSSGFIGKFVARSWWFAAFALRDSARFAAIGFCAFFPEKAGCAKSRDLFRRRVCARFCFHFLNLVEVGVETTSPKNGSARIGYSNGAEAEALKCGGRGFLRAPTYE